MVIELPLKAWFEELGYTVTADGMLIVHVIDATKQEAARVE